MLVVRFFQVIKRETGIESRLRCYFSQ